jgi:hypothetical protein
MPPIHERRRLQLPAAPKDTTMIVHAQYIYPAHQKGKTLETVQTLWSLMQQFRSGPFGFFRPRFTFTATFYLQNGGIWLDE